VISSSRLRHLVSIRNNTPTVTGQGERVDVWTEAVKRYAEIVPLEGRDFYAAQQVNSEISTRITLRWENIDLTSKSRIVYGAQVYEIVAPPINTNMEYRELVLMCKELL